MDQPRSIEVLGVHMTAEEYLHFERLLENILAGLNVIAEQPRALNERLDRILSKPERFDRT